METYETTLLYKIYELEDGLLNEVFTLGGHITVESALEAVQKSYLRPIISDSIQYQVIPTLVKQRCE